MPHLSTDRRKQKEKRRGKVSTWTGDATPREATLAAARDHCLPSARIACGLTYSIHMQIADMVIMT